MKITMIRFVASALIIILVTTLSTAVVDGYNMRKFPSEASVFFRPEKVSNRGTNDDGDAEAGTRWAILLAGSNGYENYRHQADICHAYQLLKKGGLKDENIIVFMYDDIAYNEKNPRPGVIINHPYGEDVYKGVPKDYTGEQVNVNNFLNVILGNTAALTGGSGKVLNSGPNDHVFIYYADHGAAGFLGMPYPSKNLYADELISTLKMKYASGTYKRLVLYVEACEAGSMFEGLLPQGLNIYVTTASNAVENSFATYCSGTEYETCLGDLYSVVWMEDSDEHNLQTETLEEQYLLVKDRVSMSHVMQYGDLNLDSDYLSTYMGTNSGNHKSTIVESDSKSSTSRAINQRDADLLHFWQKFLNAPEGSESKIKAQKVLSEALSYRVHVDDSIKAIGNILFGVERGPEMLNSVRPAGQPVVDDWDCLKSMVRTYETHCGSLSSYGMKYMRSIANMCNAGIKKEQMVKASAKACVTIPSNPWNTLHKGSST